jgi:hypothetical protein
MHNARRRAALSLAIVPAFLAFWGCNDSPPPVVSSKAQATVKGTVTINGTPATTGSVVFDGSNKDRPDATPVTAPIGKDGTYTIQAYIGENRITVTGKELIAPNPELQRERRVFNVQAGDNTFDINFDIKK